MSYRNDYYEILQVSPNASLEVIQAAYRRLSRMYHPDVGGEEETMKLLNEAYEVLRETESRNKYDQWFKSSEANNHQGFQAPPSSTSDDVSYAKDSNAFKKKKAHNRVLVLVSIAGIIMFLVIVWLSNGNNLTQLQAGKQAVSNNNASTTNNLGKEFTNQDFEHLYSRYILLKQENFSINGIPFVALGMAANSSYGSKDTKVKITICKLEDSKWVETWHTPKDLDTEPSTEENIRKNTEMYLPSLVVTTDNYSALVAANVLLGGAHGVDQVIAFTVDKNGQGSINLFDSAGIMSVELQGNIIVAKGEGGFSTHKLFLENGIFKQEVIPLSNASSTSDIQVKFIIGGYNDSIYAAEKSNLAMKVGETIAFVPGDTKTSNQFNEGNIQIYSDAGNGSPLTICEANRIKSGNSYRFDKPGVVHFLLTYEGNEQNLEPTFSVLVE